MDQAEQNLSMGHPTLLFIDEIHRFNKAQQDALLPYAESGLVTLIGATTENPSFEVNSALLSRAQVYVLKSLSDDELRQLFVRAQDKALGHLQFDPEAIARIRKSVNVSQSVFALYLNTTTSTIRQWEQGDKRPSGIAARSSSSTSGSSRNSA